MLRSVQSLSCVQLFATPWTAARQAFTTTNQNLEVIKVDAENNYMLIKGNVPGPRRGLVEIKTTVKRVKSVPAKELVSYAVSEEAK